MKNAQQPGGLSAVTFHGGLPYIARPAAGQIIVERFLEAELRFEPVAQFPCEGNAFPDLRTVGNTLWLIYRPQDGKSVILQNLSTGDFRVYPLIFGANWPAALGANGYAVNDLHGGAEGCRSYLYDGSPEVIAPALSAQGIARVNDENYAISTDANRGDEAEWGLLNPMYCPRVFVGENAEGGVGCVLDNRYHTVINPGTYTNMPKVAKHPDRDEWAIVTTDANYQTMTLFYGITVEDLGLVTTPPVDPPVPAERVIVLVAGESIRVSAR